MLEKGWLEDNWDFSEVLAAGMPWVGGRMEHKEQWQRLALRSHNSLGGTGRGLPRCCLAQPRDAQPAFAA